MNTAEQINENKQIANEILRQIKTGNIWVIGSWGINFKKLVCGGNFGIIIDSKKNETLEIKSRAYIKMKVSGLKHKGDIYILLNYNDEYTIIAAKTTDKLGTIKTKICHQVEGVWCENLVEVLDSIIEK